VIDSDSRRGVSSVVGVILVVALVVILAGVVGTYGLGFVEDLRDPAPNVAESEGKLVAEGDKQIIALTHVAGDSVEAEEMEIVVDVDGTSCTETSRLVNLPSDGNLDPNNIDGPDIFDDQELAGAIEDGSPDDDGVWSAGDTIEVRIVSGECGLSTGDRVTVRIVHWPTNSIVVETTLAAS
jgi:flagellin-like protein